MTLAAIPVASPTAGRVAALMPILTGANANVFYELGLRHGFRPATTVLLCAGPMHSTMEYCLCPNTR